MKKENEKKEVKEMEVKKEIKLEWDKGDEVYSVKVDKTGVEATVFIRALGAGYGNGYGTGYYVQLQENSKKWAEIGINEWNAGWACRGHGMNDSWGRWDNIPRSEAVAFIKEMIKAVEEVEDGTRDIKEIFDRIKNFVEDNIDAWVDE